MMSEQEIQYPIVNNYFLFKELGSDAVGVNYRAGKIYPEDRRAEKHSMITDVYPFLFQQHNIWKRVKILLDGVKKSNIPKLYSPEDIIIEDDKTMLVYPLLRARTFEQVMEDAAKKDMPVNFDLAFSVAFAIADLIDIGSSIVVSGEKSFHGFLTPDNVIIDYDGKILLKNYGIYPYLSREESVFAEIEKKYGAWLAPEFLRKEKLVAQTDIYHLGYILYHILTGKYFSYSAGEDFDSKFSNISFTQHIPSAEKDFLTNLITLFKKTLHPQPSQRFDNIKEFKDFVSNKFQIEELSSVTFNLAYFMNSLYLETQEEEKKELENELAYTLPEEKPEEPETVDAPKRDDHLVEDILTGLDEQKKSRSRFIIPLLALIVIVVAVSVFVVLNQQSQVKKQQEQQRQTEQDMKRSIEKFKADLENEYQRRLKEIETKATTTEEEKKQQEDEIKKLREWQKEETRKALDKQKQEEAKRKLKEQEEEDARKQKEAEQQRIKEEEEEAARKQEEAQKQKAQEEQRKKLEEAQKITEGQLIALTEASEKPVKIKGKTPNFSFILKKKYKGTEMTVRTILLIDENGAVTDVRMLAKTPDDLENVIVKSFKRWQYKPATKDGVKVKVWLPVAIRISF